MSTRRNRGWTGRGDISDFMPAPIEAEDREVEVWDGTIDMLKKAANFAAARIRYSTRTRGEIKDIAFSECCMLAAENPNVDFFELVNGAVRAVSAEFRQITASHGTYRTDTTTGARHAAYWRGDRARHHDSYGLDRIALGQVWEELPDLDRKYLLIRAAYSSNVEAAAAAGCAVSTMTKRTRMARKNAQRLWFDWESPPAYRMNRQRQRTHCRQGHSLDEHAQWIVDTNGNRVRRCGECNRIRVAAHRAKKRAAA